MLIVMFVIYALEAALISTPLCPLLPLIVMFAKHALEAVLISTPL